MEYELGYREVIPDQNFQDTWQEIILTTGGSQSTLQDIKVPERAGGYSYKNSCDIATRNRFIYWRIIHDVLELSEHSLDINLTNNRVKYKFTNTPVLDSISIHETDNLVIILVATVSSVHKLSFPHPVSVQKQVLSVCADVIVQSIFSEASIQNARDPYTFYVVPTAGLTNSPVAHAAASCLILPQEEALFAFAFNSGTILLLRLDTVTGLVHPTELKIESIVPRFLSGIATALRGRTSENEVFMSIVMHTYENDIYLFTFCKEGHLRMWSCDKAQCVAVIDVFTNNQPSHEVIENHTLRKITNCNDTLYLCTYIKLDTRCEFSIFKLIRDSTYAFSRVCTLHTSKQHLVDFSFTTSRLWALWRMTDTDSVAVTHIRLPLSSPHFNCQWETVVLAEPDDKDYVMTDPGTDPRQAYLDFIFQPGHFAFIDIIKALNIYRRSNSVLDMNLSPLILKERVCMVVEAEIQAEVIDYELLDDDYLEIVNRCWSRFYSCVLQYHMNRYRPVGLLLLPNAYGAVLLKKFSFSFLRPMEALEYLMFYNETSSASLFKEIPILQDKEKCQDLIDLVSILVFLEEHLSDEFKSTFEKELYRLRAPDNAIQNLISNSVFNKHEILSDYDFQLELHRRLENIKGVSCSIAILIEILTYNLDKFNDLETIQNTKRTQKMYSNVNSYFGSQLGVSVISKIVTQITTIRFSVCRNLLILQQIAMDKQKLFDAQSVHNINASLATKSVVITQAYYVLLWICEYDASIMPSQALLETSIQRIALLTPVNNQIKIEQSHSRSLSLLEMFIQNGARQYIKKLEYQIEQNASDFPIWHLGLFHYTTFILQLIWPITGNFYFPEWLLANCQFLVIQEYVRLLNTWCAWNSASRKFILAISLLETGELHKASDNFLRASNGVVVDSFMSTLFSLKNYSKSRITVTYYLKIIELFEQHNAQDIIIELAITAITVAEKDDLNLPTLHSIVFTQHLNLQHHIEAYNCLNINPDAGRRIDCLRQLVVALFNRKKLKDLISFPYIDMYQDLEKIMEARARSIDLMENNYYDFLYSFHINKGNMRKAASVMYEQAMRLSQESYSLLTISKQTNCLLACINVLSLVNEKFRWIVRPVVDDSYTDDNSTLRKKRNLSGHEILQCKHGKRIEVLELHDIRMEYALASAKLKLTKIDPEIHNVSSSCPSEIVAVLSNYGLHLHALDVCKYFKLSKIYVLENLVSQCARLDHEEHRMRDFFNEIQTIDYNLMTSNEMNISWRSLENFISQNEEKGKSELHKAVTKQLLHHEIFLPEWLYSSYAKKNAPELLRLLIQMGRLDEAAYFSIKYIQAILGKGKEYFNLELSLSVTTSSTCFPFNHIEMLLLELEYAAKNDPSYLSVCKRLKDEYTMYLKSVRHVSRNMVLMKKNAKRTN